MARKEQVAASGIKWALHRTGWGAHARRVVLVAATISLLACWPSPALGANPTVGGISATVSGDTLTVNGSTNADSIQIKLVTVPTGSVCTNDTTVTPNIPAVPSADTIVIQIIDVSHANEAVYVVPGPLDAAGLCGDSVAAAATQVVVDTLPTTASIKTIIVRAGDENDTVDASLLTGSDVPALSIFGEGGNDVLTGSDGPDSINGGPGDDILNGGPDDDILNGGPGNDLVRGDQGADTMGGGGGVDVLDYATDAGPSPIVVDLRGDPPGTATDGWGDEDVIGTTTGTGFSVVRGKATDDTIYGHSTIKTTILGGDGNDLLVGGTAAGDIIFGEGGADTIWGRDWDGVSTVVDDQDQDDILIGGAGSDIIEGFSGSDIICGDGDPGPQWPPLGADAVAAVTPVIPPAVIPGDLGNDTIRAGTGSDLVYGGAGNDRIYGDSWNGTDSLPLNDGDGSDTIYGDFDYDSDADGVWDADVTQGGSDTIRGGAGSDYLVGGAGNDRIYGGDGADTLEGNFGNDQLYGGEANGKRDNSVADTVTYEHVQSATAPSAGLPAGEGVVAELSTGPDYISAYGSVYPDGDALAGPGTSSRDTLNGIENITGSVNNDILRGSNSDNIALRLTNGGYDNIVNGGDGDDFLMGRRGVDHVIGGAGDDFLWGDDMSDAYGSSDLLDGGAGDDDLHGEAGDDLLRGGGGQDRFSGGPGTDAVDYSDAVSGVIVNLRQFNVDIAVAGGLGDLATTANLPFNPKTDLVDLLPGGQIPAGTKWGATAAGTIQTALTATDGGVTPAIDTFVRTNIDRIETVLGSDYDDVLMGDDTAATTIYGGAGNDMLFGGAGDDVLDGDRDSVLSVTTSSTPGDDVLEGDAGNDRIIGGGNRGLATGYPDSVTGVYHGDYACYSFVLNAGVGGAVTVNLDLGNSAAQNTSAAGLDTIQEMENIVGSNFNDILTGDGNANVIRALAGNDTLAGRGDVDPVIANVVVPTQDLLDGGANGAAGDVADYRQADPTIVTLVAGVGATNDGEGGSDQWIGVESAFAPSNAMFVSAGPDVTISPGGSAVLQGAVTGGSPAYTYRWDTEPPTTLPPGTPTCEGTCCIPSASLAVPGMNLRNILQPTVTPTQTTTYRLTVWDSYCLVGSDFVVVTVSTAMNVSAGADKSITLGQQVQLDGSVSGGVPPYTVAWTPAAGLSATNILLPKASPSTTTTYTLTVTDSLLKSVTDTVTVTVTNPFFVDAGFDVTIASGSNTQLSATVTGGTGTLTYSWAPVTGLSAANIANPVATPTSTTAYTVTVTDSTGRSASDTMVVTVASASTPVDGNTGGSGGSTGQQGGSVPPPQSSGSSTPVLFPSCGWGISSTMMMVNLVLLGVMIRRRWR